MANPFRAQVIWHRCRCYITPMAELNACGRPHLAPLLTCAPAAIGRGLMNCASLTCAASRRISEGIGSSRRGVPHCCSPGFEDKPYAVREPTATPAGTTGTSLAKVGLRARFLGVAVKSSGDRPIRSRISSTAFKRRPIRGDLTGLGVSREDLDPETAEISLHLNLNSQTR